jgi:glycosyltransferase involved in cell wall biosynthesis
MNPFISICIPAFKRIDFLKRLLDSILSQSYLDFEVVITDDSPSSEVADLCKRYENDFAIYYYKNAKPLGTPENWNESIRMAKGEWIKLMHDDDWFADEESLQEYADAAADNPNEEFVFGAYRNVFDKSGKTREVFVSTLARGSMHKNPAILFGSNLIGPPSVVMHKNKGEFWYDPKIKWVVDIDFYIRYLGKYRAVYIPEILVNVGMHDEQVTASSFRVSKVEIPENFYLLNKIGPSKLKSVSVYDAWWRLMRNLQIRNPGQLREAGYDGEIPAAIQSMIKWQKNLSPGLLRIGPISKFFMLSNYIRNFGRLQ